MKLLNLALLFLVFCTIKSSSAQQSEIIVGGIFHGDDEVSQIAFKHAIEWVNSRMLPFQLTAKVFNVSRTDSFQAQVIACDLLSEGVDVIFGPNSPETSGIVSSIAEKYEVPHIVYHWKPKTIQPRDYFKDKTMTLNLYPDSEVLSEALSNVLKDFDWKSYAVVYEDKENLVKLKDVLQNHEPKSSSNPVIIHQMTENNYGLILKDIKNHSETRIVLDISTDKIVTFLKAANEVGMLTDYYSYFITNLDAYTLESEMNAIKNSSTDDSLMSNITCIRLIDKDSDDLKTATRIWKQREFKAFLSEDHIPVEFGLVHDAVQFYSKALHLYTAGKRRPSRVRQSCSDNRRSSSHSGYELARFMKNRDIEGITGRVQFNNDPPHNGSRVEFQVTILELINGTFDKIGLWDTTNKVYDLRDTEAADAQIAQAIEKKHFKIVVKIGDPFLMEVIPKEGDPQPIGNARYHGYVVDLINRLKGILKFPEYTLEVIHDNAYGNLNKATGKWNGLVRHLLDGKADLAVADISITYERKTAVDFTVPFMNLGIGILMKVDDPKENDPFSFHKPFGGDVWFWTSLAYLSISLMVFILSRINIKDWEPAHPCVQNPEEVESIWNVLNCVWLAMGSIMGQGCDILPKGSPTRIITGTWWFFALIMLASYTANLAAFLTTEKMASSIDSAEDLVKQTSIQYGAVVGGSTIKFFQQSNFSTYQRMWAAMETAGDSVHSLSNAEGVKRVERGKYAFMMESVPMEYETNKNCKLRRVGGLLDSKGYGIALPINSPYRKLFSEAILTLSEKGDLNTLKEKWWRPELRKKCEMQTQENSMSLDIENVGGVFIVLGAGLLFAFFIACIEFLVNVGKVAIDQKISHWEAFKSEFYFAFNIFVVTKPVRTGSSEAIISRRSTPPRSLKSRSRLGSESRSLKNKSNRSLNYDDVDHENNSKSLLDLQ